MNEQAAAWFVRLQQPDVPREEREAFERWMDDPAHAVAYARVEHAWDRSERLRALSPPVQRSVAPPRRYAQAISRRAASVALLGAGAAGTLGFGLARQGRRHSTELGERKAVRMADGSLVHLNTASRVEIEDGRRVRRVRLLSGEALFDVAKDPGRPFVVEAGESTVRALGTAFNVRLREAAVEVTVVEGSVAVTSPAAAPPPGEGLVRPDPHLARLVAGQAAVLAPGAIAEVALDPAVVQRRVVWTEGVIDLRGETVEQAIAEFNRYSDTKLVVGDPTLASLRIGGTFGTHERDKFVAALETGFDVRAVNGENATYLVPARK